MNLSDISIKFTEDILDEIIQKHGGIKHTGWRLGDGFKRGDSYLSEVYRIIADGIDVNGSPLQVSMVVKSLPNNIGRRKTFRSTDFFRNECNFYNKVWSRMKEFQIKKSVPPTLAFHEIPECLAAYFDGENDFIILQDLRPLGYSSASRQDGLDLNHCKLIMKSLGRFHAMSLAIKDQDPKLFQEIMESIEETYYADQYEQWYAPFLRDQLIVARDAINREYGGSVYEQKMHAFTDGEFYKKMVELTHRNGPYSVIGHGDCWVPNFLMSYPDGDNNPLETRIIDFQLARYASPVLDISFFIYSCTSQELRSQYYDELLRHYHTAATELINALGSDAEKVFPWSGLQAELKEYARFGMGMSMESLPVSIMDDADIPDLDTIEGEVAIPLTDIWIIKPIKSKEGRLRIADALKHGIDQGYLD